MASMTFSNPGVGNLFSGLAGVLGGPDPQKLMQADYLRTQRDNVMSDTAINAQKLATAQREEAAMRSLADVLGNPALAQTPEGRADLMSVLSQVPGGLKDGPGFAMGASSFTDPNFMPEDSDFSRALVGTGVQTDWGNTPTGYQQGLDNAVTLQTMKNEGDLAVAGVKGTGVKGATPPLVNPKMAEDFAAMMAAALTSKFGQASVEPSLSDQLTSRATQLFQTTRNAPLAVQQAMEEAGLSVSGANDGIFGTGFFASPGEVTGNPIEQAVQSGDTTGLGDALSTAPAAPPVSTTPEPLPQVAPDPAATPAASPAASPGVAAPAGAPAEGPPVHTQADGTAFIVGPNNTPIPLVDGVTKFRGANSGVVIIWKDGRWQPVTGA